MIFARTPRRASTRSASYNGSPQGSTSGGRLPHLRLALMCSPLRRSPLALLAMAALLSLCAACHSVRPLIYYQDKADPKNEVADTATLHPKPFKYRARPGDIIFVRVATLTPGFNAVNSDDNNANAGSPYERGLTVADDGTMRVPQAGVIHAAGHTLGEINTELTDSLSRYLNHFTVIVKVLSFKVTVQGEVNKPGIVPVLGESITLPEAITYCADMTPFGNRRNVKVLRKQADGSVKTFVTDYTDQNVVNSPIYYLQPDDIVYIEPTKGRLRILYTPVSAYLIPSVSLLAIVVNTYLNRQK